MRRVMAPLMAVGLSLTGIACGESAGVPQEVMAAHTQVLNQYDCQVPEARIKVSDLAARSIAAFGDERGKALTDAEGIELDDDLTTKEMARLVIHETLHWCADRKNRRHYPNPLNIPGVGMLTDANGFVPYINGAEAGDNTFVEEGVIDWLAKHVESYEPHPDYAVIAALTDSIAQHRGFDAQAVVKLLRQDDLIGLVGLMKNKSTAEVTGQDVKGIVILYMDTYYKRHVPTDEELHTMLDA